MVLDDCEPGEPLAEEGALLFGEAGVDVVRVGVAWMGGSRF